MSRWPAIVSSYSADSRTCRVSIPGLTDGAEILPEAQIEYPIGDAFDWTEIEILSGDLCWIDFIGGDQRYPIITGWRAPQTGNANGWRAFRHANIKAVAAEVLKLVAGSDMNFSVGGTSIDMTTGAVKLVSGGTLDVTTSGAATITINGAATVKTAGDANVTVDGQAKIAASGSVEISGASITFKGS
jgi:hypothetical protein